MSIMNVQLAGEYWIKAYSKISAKIKTPTILLNVVCVLIYWFFCWSPVVSFFGMLFVSVDQVFLVSAPASFYTLTNRNSAFFKWFLKINEIFSWHWCPLLKWLLLFPLCEFMNEWRSQLKSLIVMWSYAKPLQSWIVCCAMCVYV